MEVQLRRYEESFFAAVGLEIGASVPAIVRLSIAPLVGRRAERDAKRFGRRQGTARHTPGVRMG